MTNRGQAMIESLLVGLILVLAISFFLRVMVKAQKSFLIDEFMEQTLICLIQDKSTCTHALRQKLTEQGFTSILIRTQKTTGKWILQISAISLWKEKIDKESELAYEAWKNI